MTCLRAFATVVERRKIDIGDGMYALYLLRELLLEQTLNAKFHGKQADWTINARPHHLEVDCALFVNLQHLYVAAVHIKVGAVVVQHCLYLLF